MFIKFLYLCLFYFLFQLTGFCYSEDIINELEYQKYGSTFQNESLAKRLSNLEIDVLGMEQKGSIEERLNLLQKISNNKRTGIVQKPFYKNYQSKKKSAIRSFLDNIGNIGVITGLTPPINYEDYNNSPYYDSYRYKNVSHSYNKEFENFLDNQNNHHLYHNNTCNNHLRNKYWQHNYNHHNHNYNHSYNSYNRIPENKITKNFYIPPTIQSRSSIHII